MATRERRRERPAFIERTMDAVANALGIDPLELRRRSFGPRKAGSGRNSQWRTARHGAQSPFHTQIEGHARPTPIVDLDRLGMYSL
jgi:CO/xanthine dehydrogenase Mo-binding subunit